MLREKRGKGYIGKAMSVNAFEAHKQGILPISKWRKTIFVEKIESNYSKTIKRIKGSYKKYLEYDSYHHTGALYSVTDFYTINYESVDEAIKEGNIIFYTEEELEQIENIRIKEIEEQKKKIEKEAVREKQEEDKIKKELEGAEKISRLNKKGTEITTILITKKENTLYDKITNKKYLPLKDYSRILGIDGIIEVKIKEG